MMDVAVFEQAPKLQAGQQERVVWGVRMAKSAVETIDRPQLHVLLQHHKLHLLAGASGQGRGGDKDVSHKTLWGSFCTWRQELTRLRSVSRFFSGIFSRRQSMLRAMSGPSLNESPSDKGDPPAT